MDTCGKGLSPFQFIIFSISLIYTENAAELLDQLSAWVSEFFPGGSESRAMLYIEKAPLVGFWESRELVQPE